MIMSNPQGPYPKAQLAKFVQHGFIPGDTLVHHVSQTSSAGIPVGLYIAHWQQRHIVEYAGVINNL